MTKCVISEQKWIEKMGQIENFWMSHIKNERYKDELYSSNHPFIVAIVWFVFDYSNFILSNNAVEDRKDQNMTDEDHYMTIKNRTHLYD